MSKSQLLFDEAVKYIPGGVNSPVRAFKSVHEIPKFIKKADKQFIYDVDGNKYIDYVCSWGPMILGHNNEIVKKAVINAVQNGLSFGAATENEVIMAKLICELVPAVEMVRMVNSGTEAVMSAVRTARGFTGKSKIIKFEGCYHGHSDSMLVKAGSGLLTSGEPDSDGVLEGCTKDTLLAVYNDIESVKLLFEKYYDDIAAVIIEPVAANMGVVIPESDFLKELRMLCDKYNSLLIFDEVITGFRLQIDGASGYFNVKPDLITFGKIIGAGMPVGAYGGRKDIMEVVSPCGKVYQAGTLSGNPVAMAAGISQLNYLKNNKIVYEHINNIGRLFFEGVKDIINRFDVDCSVNYIGSIGSIFFNKSSVKNYNDAKNSNLSIFERYFKFMINNGVYTAPSQFESMFISYAHSKEDIEKTLNIIEMFFQSEGRG